jgi:hypothetical protein
MATQLVVIEAIVIKYNGNNENGRKIFFVVCLPKTTKKKSLISFKRQVIYVERKIEARSCKHYCNGRAVIIT